MTNVFLALGSNVGDSQKHIAKAVELLARQVVDIKEAPIYVSKAVGYTNQPDFLNTAITGRTKLAPRELLEFVKSAEVEVGRVERFRWGPREIDIDIIFYDDQIVDEPGLTIPHPRFAERDFVLKPLAQLNPSFVDPVSKLTVRRLLEKLPAGEQAITGELQADE